MYTLINPYPYYAVGINEATIEPPLGLGYCASYLRMNGFDCDIIDANVLRWTADDVLRSLRRTAHPLIGISTNIVTHRAGIELARAIKAGLGDVPIVMGGPFPTSRREYVLAAAGVDAVAVGEGEVTLSEIAGNIAAGRHPFRGVRGCVYRDNGAQAWHGDRPLIPDLNTIPFPAHDLFPPLHLYKSRARRSPVGAVVSARGCYYQCVYCNKSIFGNVCRHRSVDNIISEVEWLREHKGIRQLDFLDDNIIVTKKHACELFDRLGPLGLAINLQNGIRADRCDRELLQKMRDAGVFKISIGVESGDPAIQRRIKKGIDLEKVLLVSRWARELGIEVYGNFMLGLPGDTPGSMRATVEFAKRMDPHVANFMITIPLPGTELYEEVLRDGKMLIDTGGGIESGFYGCDVFYLLPGMDKDAIVRTYKAAYWEFYARPKKVWDVLTHARSLNEFRWIFNAAVAALTPMLSRKRRGGS